MKPANYNELYKAVENKEIISAKSKEKTFRLFIATNGVLCYFKPRSGRNGYRLSESDFETLISFQAPILLSEDDKLKKQYAEIAKYKKMAEKATFTNSWIEDCKNIPNFEEWKKDLKTDNFGTPCDPRPKNLYELGITTGNKIDSKVISIDRIAKQYPNYARMLRENIANQKAGVICSHVPFAGYDMSLSTANKESSTGEFMGYLSIEFKGCGNGYYYLLINDDNFIGYDVD